MTKMEHPDISFVLVAKNEQANIGDCIDSIRRSVPPAWTYEVTLVDNGSDDATVEIASSRGIKVLIAPGVKVSALRNRGARLSSGTILVFLDADVVISPDWFMAMHELIVNYQGDCACSAEGWYGLRPTWVEQEWCNFKGLKSGKGAERVNWCQSGAFMILRRAFETTGGFDESLATCEDFAFGLRMKACGLTILKRFDVPFQHKRVPKTLKELFWQQVWHGSHSHLVRHDRGIIGFAKARFSHIFLLLSATCAATLLYSRVALFPLAVLIAFSAGHVYYRKFGPVRESFCRKIAIVFTFFVARGVSAVFPGKRVSDSRLPESS
jgi:glycosyltransferase involved in cell wall biosynthesis